VALLLSCVQGELPVHRSDLQAATMVVGVLFAYDMDGWCCLRLEVHGAHLDCLSSTQS